MYNPSRGGVRGGADQFTWESVKNDKHRENYLGHSLMAPVGRWQKGKDLSWYAKERNETSTSDKPDKSELASIKRAEEEAMLIALGHNIVRKTQALSKEDMCEALKRNAGDRDEHNTERVDGVGASSQRVALLSGVSKDSRPSNEGVVFECRRERNAEASHENEKRDSITDDRKKNKKKSKHKKEKKHKKHHKESYHSDSSDSNTKHRMRHEKNGSDSDNRLSSNQKTHKMSKRKHRNYSPDRSDEKSYTDSRKKNHKRHKKQNDSEKRRRHDTSGSD